MINRVLATYLGTITIPPLFGFLLTAVCIGLPALYIVQTSPAGLELVVGLMIIVKDRFNSSQLLRVGFKSHRRIALLQFTIMLASLLQIAHLIAKEAIGIDRPFKLELNRFLLTAI